MTLKRRFSQANELCNSLSSYWFIRILAYPLQWMPYSWIHCLGKWIGNLIFYCMPSYRKRTLSNLGLATDLALSKQEILQIAKESFQNLAIVCLEYPRLGREKTLSPSIYCENPETATALHKEKKGIIFFCGHLSNWEVLFLDGTTRMQGVAIGKPIKNQRLYRWIVSIREKYGGKIIAQKNGIAEGLRALKKGDFIGIVGDQGMPSSGYSSLFLGRRAWTSTAPALLAYRTGLPIIVALTRRTKNGYRISYSEPIWPQIEEPAEREVIRLMNDSLAILQEEIKKNPGQWLWQHNRWKQQTPKNVYKRFRHDSIGLVLPPERSLVEKMLPHLSVFRQIYPLDFFLLFAPASCQGMTLPDANEIVFYSDLKETLREDYRCKLFFDLANYGPLRRHYLSFSAFEVLNLGDLKNLSAPHLPTHLKDDLSAILQRALSRPGSLWQKEKIHAS